MPVLERRGVHVEVDEFAGTGYGNRPAFLQLRRGFGRQDDPGVGLDDDGVPEPSPGYPDAVAPIVLSQSPAPKTRLQRTLATVTGLDNVWIDHN